MPNLLVRLCVNLVLVLSWLTTMIWFRRRVPRPSDIRGVLVFQLTELGDVALTTDVLWRLRDHYPGARIILACGPWAKPMMEGQPCVDEVFAYQSNLTMTAKHGKLGIREHWRLVLEMSNLPIDLIVDLRGNLGSIMAAWLSPARYRVDRGSLRWEDYWTKRQVWNRHEVSLNLDVVKPLGIHQLSPCLKLVPMSDTEESLKGRLDQVGLSLEEPFVVLHPGSSWIDKRWREERFAELADKIQFEYGVQVVLTGSKSEQSIGEKVVSLMHHKPVNLIGRVSIREILSIYALAALWVGNDTGTMHVAVALGRPVIVLWGPTKLEKFGPCGINAQVIVGKGNLRPEDGERAKMDLIQVSDVWNAVQTKLKKEMIYVQV